MSMNQPPVAPDATHSAPYRTERGFGMFADFVYRDYQDADESRFTVQESSLATEVKVWVGVAGSSGRAHLGVDEPRAVRDALSAFLAEAGEDDG